MGGSWEPEETAPTNAKDYYENWNLHEQFAYLRRAMGRAEEVGAVAPGWSSQSREKLMARLIHAFVGYQIVFGMEDREWVVTHDHPITNAGPAVCNGGNSGR